MSEHVVPESYRRLVSLKKELKQLSSPAPANDPKTWSLADQESFQVLHTKLNEVLESLRSYQRLVNETKLVMFNIETEIQQLYKRNESEAHVKRRRIEISGIQNYTSNLNTKIADARQDVIRDTALTRAQRDALERITIARAAIGTKIHEMRRNIQFYDDNAEFERHLKELLEQREILNDEIDAFFERHHYQDHDLGE